LQGIDDDPGRAHPRWRVSLLDLGHTDGWSWGVDAAAMRKIVQFLTEMERLTWTEVRAQMARGKKRAGLKHKFIPAENVCNLAQQRLAEIKLDEFDQLFRFRLGNFERLWGVIHEHTFYPVWWDPDHKVCPLKDRD
jgi:hypothetical protein